MEKDTEFKIFKTEFKISKSEILETAEDCPQIREVLKKMFPGAFEKKLYLCGTVFVDSEFFCSPFISLKSIEHFYILAHAAKPRAYHLINLSTGFPRRSPGKKGYSPEEAVFIRQDWNKGVEIPEDYLKGLEIWPPDNM